VGRWLRHPTHVARGHSSGGSGTDVTRCSALTSASGDPPYDQSAPDVSRRPLSAAWCRATYRRAPLGASGPPRSRSAALRSRDSPGSPSSPIRSALSKSGSMRTWRSSARGAGPSASRRARSRRSSSSGRIGCWSSRLVSDGVEGAFEDVALTACHARIVEPCGDQAPTERFPL
jgi:hypothetical protein